MTERSLRDIAVIATVFVLVACGTASLESASDDPTSTTTTEAPAPRATQPPTTKATTTVPRTTTTQWWNRDPTTTTTLSTLAWKRAVGEVLLNVNDTWTSLGELAADNEMGKISALCAVELADLDRQVSPIADLAPPGPRANATFQAFLTDWATFLDSCAGGRIPSDPLVPRMWALVDDLVALVTAG